MENEARRNHEPKILRNSLYFIFGTLSSRLLGLARDLLMVSLFSPVITDAWASAFRIPNFIRRVFGEGAMNSGLIPILTHKRNQNGLEYKNEVSEIHLSIFVLTLVIVLLMIIFASDIMAFMVANDYQARTSQFQNTVYFFKIMIGFLGLWILSSFMNALLIFNERLFWPNIAPTLFNLVMIVFILLPQKYFSINGSGLAWGVLVGGFVQWLVLKLQIPISSQISWHQLHKKVVVQFFKLFLIPAIAQSGYLILNLINLKYISRFSEGTISYFYLCERLLEFPISLISVSLGSALLPLLSKAFVEKNNELFAAELNESMRINFLLTLPSAVGLWVLAQPICQVLFLRGEIHAEALPTLTLILKYFTINLVFLGVIKIINNIFFAIHRPQVPLKIVGIVILFHVVFTTISVNQYGLEGLLISTLISTALLFLIKFIFLRSEFKKISFVFLSHELRKEIGKYIFASFCMFFVLDLCVNHLDLNSFKIIKLAAIIVAGVGAYFSVLKFIKAKIK